ncbi:FtsH protease activity modulator HflK [Gallaecimonas xiamenensis]|uniref:Protein HflK n=1 Tax=Gallaecimonas xiamenensis 3-C-1 TaxID=745411 RepID=K2IZ72_9GAMM|nr:FtsH protease activity modulator HflK [Gallaecimonas xiamenensis]EKE67857.1 HflK protein [Gallaecimonas xiamenensis 3-C-1]
MAWNEPGNNKDKDPWGKPRGNDQGPPDFDEMMKKLGSRMGGVFGSGPGKGVSFSGLALILVLVAAVWGLSGFYTIKNAEQGVVLHFGSYKETVASGLHWKPTFIDKVYPVDVGQTRSIPASGFMLTKDENMVNVAIEVQYRIANPYKFLFSATDAVDSLTQAIDASLRYVIGHNTMEDARSTDRKKVRNETRTLLEQTIAQYDLGVEITDVNFLSAAVPDEVNAAFQDAIAAEEDEKRFKREATAYSNKVVPVAEGKALRIKQEAEAYKEQVVFKAQGEVARFEKLLPEYKANPVVTRDRLYIETMEEVLSNSSKVLVDSDANNMLYLPLDKMLENQKGRSAPNYQNEIYQMPQRSTDSLSDFGNSAADPRAVDRSGNRTGRN